MTGANSHKLGRMLEFDILNSCDFGVELCFVTVDWRVRESRTDGRLLSGYRTGAGLFLFTGYRTSNF